MDRRGVGKEIPPDLKRGVRKRVRGGGGLIVKGSAGEVIFARPDRQKEWGCGPISHPNAQKEGRGPEQKTPFAMVHLY